MEHTKEPWEVGISGITVVLKNKIIACCNNTPIGEANAKRIVACVNACDGFSEAELETLGHFKAMHETIVAENAEFKRVNWEDLEHLHKIEAERDALLEEVERLRKLIKPTSSGTREGDGC